ncbi:MAG TPA: SIR2 family protein [Candidatus Binataceae bacterium]
MSSTEPFDPVEIYTDRNVYILGAGFSHDAGLPLVSEFMNKMRDGLGWLKSKNRNEEADAIERVFNFRRIAASATERIPIGTENIEELFSLASATSTFANPSSPLARAVPIAIAATLDYALQDNPPKPDAQVMVTGAANIPRDWIHTGGLDRSGQRQDNYRCPLYDAYALVLAGTPGDRNSEEHNTIISFNYDLLLEDAFAKLNIPFSYGLSLEDADFETSGMCVPELADEAAIRVLKLHGSINWATPPAKLQKSTIYNDYDHVRKRNRLPFLAPPTWRKVFGDQLSIVWDRAVESLQSATRVIILGYSIPTTDQHFKYLLSAGLQGNISLRQIWFVNPGIDRKGESEVLRERLFSVFRPELAPQVLQLSDSKARDFLVGAGKYWINRQRVSASYRV